MEKFEKFEKLFDKKYKIKNISTEEIQEWKNSPITKEFINIFYDFVKYANTCGRNAYVGVVWGDKNNDTDIYVNISKIEKDTKNKKTNKQIYTVLDIAEIPNGWDIDKTIDFFNETGILVLDSFNKPTGGKLNSHFLFTNIQE